MPDDLKKSGRQDDNKVSANQDWEISYMTEKFGVTATEVQNAVQAVGNQRDRVEAYLAKHKKGQD